MKTVLFVLGFVMFVAGSSLAVVDPAPNSMGIYWDAAADMPCRDAVTYPVNMYIVMTNPTMETLGGFECAYTIVGDAQPYILSATFTNPDALDVASGFQNFIVGFGTPETTHEATVLVTLSVLNAQGVDLSFFLHEASPTSIEGVFPTIISDSVLMQTTTSSQPGHVTAYMGAGDCPVVIGSGTYLPYFENFNDGLASGLDPVSGNWTITNNTYFCRNDQQNTKHISTVGQPEWYDYQVDVDLLANGAPYQEILVRYQSPDDYYIITVLPEPYNSYSLYKMANGTETQLLSGGDFPNASGQWHNMVVEVSGPVIRAYLDDQLVFGYVDHDAPLLTGKVGLVSYAGNSSYMEASFDNLHIDEISSDSDATLSPDSANLGTLPCYGSQSVTYVYAPDVTSPPVKGYSVRIQGSDQASFDSSDITVHTVPAGEQSFSQVIQNGPNDFTIDYAILGSQSPGIIDFESLFTIDLHGASDGFGSLNIVQADFRDTANITFPVNTSFPATYEVDCTPPLLLSNCQVTPGHEKTTLNWDQQAFPGIVETQIFRAQLKRDNGQTAYPLYGLLEGNQIPTRPAGYTEILASEDWVYLGAAEAGTQTYTDLISERGIYYYELYSIDLGGYSAPSIVESLTATNYWLGDIDTPHDGTVEVGDLSALAATYGANTGDALFNNLSDVGPTDDATGKGIPLPDGYVGFDDLMIISQNFGEVGPEKSGEYSTGPVFITWEQVTDKEWICTLESAPNSFKGLNLVGQLPPGVSAACIPGSLLSSQPSPVFLRNAVPEDLDIGLALMGQGLTIEGSGELLRVVLNKPADLSHVKMEARSIFNQVLTVNVESPMVPTLPVDHLLRQNYPNPFNPSTTISFELPKDGNVKVAVYSIDGSLVRVLAEGQYQAGSHDVIWNGSDETGRRVASGTYFCRMVSGDFYQIVKMVLAK